jgi:hypothetical protein
MLRHGFIPRGTAAARLIKIATKHHRFKKERGAGEELMIDAKENRRHLNIGDLCVTHHPISRFHPFAKFLRTRCQNDFLIT